MADVSLTSVARSGDELTLTGSGFTRTTTAVYADEESIPFEWISDTELKVTVSDLPQGASKIGAAKGMVNTDQFDIPADDTPIEEAVVEPETKAAVDEIAAQQAAQTTYEAEAAPKEEPEPPKPPLGPIATGETSQRYDGETDPAQIIKARNIQRVMQQQGFSPDIIYQTPEISELDPAEVAAASPDDFVLTVRGTAFAPGSQIIFNGHEEPTTLVSDTEATTIVKPSLFVVAAVCPVMIRSVTGLDSAPVDFTFTEPVPPEEPALEEHPAL